MPGQVLVDKIPFDFKSMEIEITGYGVSFGICNGVETVEYNCSIDRTKVWGASRDPLLRSEGQADYDGSITMYKYWWNYLVAKSREIGVPLGMLELVIPVTFYTKDGFTDTDTIAGARFANINFSLSEGTDLAMIEVPLDIMTVYYSGVTVWGDTLGDGAPVAGGSRGQVMGASRPSLVNSGFVAGTGFGGGVSFP